MCTLLLLYTRNLFSDQNLNIWFSSLFFFLCVQKLSNKVILLVCVSLPRNVANFSFKVSPTHLRGKTRGGTKKTKKQERNI